MKLVSKIFDGTEERWYVNANNDGVLWNVLSLQNMHAAIFDIVASDPRYRRRARYFADEHERGEHHANFDSEGEVGHNGKRHGDEPYRDISGAEFQNFWDFLPFAHVIGDDHEDRGQRGERNVL